MSMNNGTADTLAAAMVSALGLTGDAATQALVHWKAVCRTLYSGLKTDAVIPIPTSSIVTTGGPVTQTGPAAPVNLSLT